MKIENHEIILMNKIIINAINTGGDVAPYFSYEKGFNENLQAWLKLRGFDKQFKVSKDDWHFIIPIDEEDIEPVNPICEGEEYFSAWCKSRDKREEWYDYFVNYPLDEVNDFLF